MKIGLPDDGERGIIFVLNRKVRLRTQHKGPDREQKYSSTLSLSLASDGGWVVTPAPQPLCLRERDPAPIMQKDGWAPGTA
jgi:hypothetical protein